MSMQNNFEFDAFGIWCEGRYGTKTGAPDPAQVKICKEWIGRFGIVTKGINHKGRTSYGWKHVVEHRMGEYVSNGAFIQAAIECGLKIKPEPNRSPNVLVNLSKSCGPFNKGPGYTVYRCKPEAEFAKNGTPLYSGKISDTPSIKITYLLKDGTTA